MRRSLAAATAGLLAGSVLLACGGTSCESLQADIEEIGREIQQDPSKAMDDETAEELQALQAEMQEMGCFE